MNRLHATASSPPAYPVTPVLRGSGGRFDDILMTSAEASVILARGPFAVQEKLDGINLGIAATAEPQWVLKKPELAPMAARGGLNPTELRAAIATLSGRAKDKVLYFEWLDPKRLRTAGATGWFLIDILDPHTGRFLAAGDVDAVASGLGVSRPPQLGTVELTSVAELHGFFGPSEVARGEREGMVLRRERDGCVQERYKFVRPGHRQRHGGPAW